MRPLIPLVAFILVAGAATAQKIELKINANVNLTWLPDFKNRVYIVDGFVTPNVININNARNPPVITETNSRTSASPGFTIEAEAGKELNNQWKVSFSLGIMQMGYNYDTYISQSFYGNSVNLRSSETRFTYLTSRPVNVSRTFNRFSVQGGAVINYLVGKKLTNAVVIYNYATNHFEAVGAFFEEKGDAQKFLIGAHLNTRYAIGRRIEMMLGGQYFFNSVYKKEGTFKPLRDKSKPLQMQLGVSYRIVTASR